jgi:hypothetical protein
VAEVNDRPVYTMEEAFNIITQSRRPLTVCVSPLHHSSTTPPPPPTFDSRSLLTPPPPSLLPSPLTRRCV